MVEVGVAEEVEAVDVFGGRQVVAKALEAVLVVSFADFFVFLHQRRLKVNGDRINSDLPHHRLLHLEFSLSTFSSVNFWSRDFEM